MASPHVAGVLALMKSVHPTWTPAQMIDKLRQQADVKACGTTTAGPVCVGPVEDNSFFGEGVVDALDADQPGSHHLTTGRWRTTPAALRRVRRARRRRLPCAGWLRSRRPVGTASEWIVRTSRASATSWVTATTMTSAVRPLVEPARSHSTDDREGSLDAREDAVCRRPPRCLHDLRDERLHRRSCTP